MYQNNIKYSYYLSLICLPRAISPKTNEWMTLIYDVMRLSMIKCRFPRRCEWLKGYSLFGAVRSSYLRQPPPPVPATRHCRPAGPARPGPALPSAYGPERIATGRRSVQRTASSTAYCLQFYRATGCMVYTVLRTGCVTAGGQLRFPV